MGRGLGRENFPIFKNDPGLVYLDSAASALRPQSVIDKEVEFYSRYPVNIHRGVYKISERATEEYEEAREEVARFLGANRSGEIIFVRNATEAINLVAYSWGRTFVGHGDEIALTVMEHHANMLPWQQLAEEVGANLRYLDIDEEGNLPIRDENIVKWVNKKTKLVAIAHASNVLGTVNDVQGLTALVKKVNPKVKVLVDGAQAVPRLPVSVAGIGCDFYAVTGHKMYGPSGIGALWAREEVLREMPPFETGGGMIKEVRLNGASFADPPEKFEAGTPNIAGAIGLGAAVRSLLQTGMKNVWKHEVELNQYAFNQLDSVPGLKIYGPRDPAKKTAIYTFSVQGIHPHDLSQLLDEDNIAVRAGHHCAMPLHMRLGVVATTRASCGVYTTKRDIDRLVEGIEKAKRRLG